MESRNMTSSLNCSCYISKRVFHALSNPHPSSIRRISFLHIHNVQYVRCTMRSKARGLVQHGAAARLTGWRRVTQQGVILYVVHAQAQNDVLPWDAIAVKDIQEGHPGTGAGRRTGTGCCSKRETYRQGMTYFYGMTYQHGMT